MDDLQPLPDEPSSPASWFAPVIVGAILALPGLWVALSSIGFQPHNALDAMAIVAWAGAGGGTCAAVPLGALVACIPKNPLLGVVVGLIAGTLAFGAGAYAGVGMLMSGG